jgi:hypothetical protein
MDTQSTEKKAKSASKPTAHASLRVRRDTRKRVLAELARINKKDFGRKVRTDELIALAISLVTPEHISELQDASLSNADRFEQDYRAFISTHGPITKDAYLGKRLNGEIATSQSNIQPGNEQKAQ